MHRLSFSRLFHHSGRHLMVSRFKMSPTPTGTKGRQISTRVSELQIMSLPLFKLINCTPVKLQINERDGAIVFSHILLRKISPNISGGPGCQKINLK